MESRSVRSWRCYTSYRRHNHRNRRYRDIHRHANHMQRSIPHAALRPLLLSRSH
eukprot:COSAG01_NODE_61820_length_287_cov_1.654255_1_plen_53_part_10